MGVVSLRDLVMAPFDTLISDIMNDNVISVRTDLDQEAVARLFTKYGYAALPVVDENGRMATGFWIIKNSRYYFNESSINTSIIEEYYKDNF